MSNEKAFCVRLLILTRLDMPEKLGHCVICPNCWLLTFLAPEFCHSVISSGDELSGIHMTTLESHICAVVLVQVWHSSVRFCCVLCDSFDKKLTWAFNMSPFISWKHC